MKPKAVSGIMLTLLLIGVLTLVFNIQTVNSFGEALVYIDPPTNTVRLGETFTLNITVSNVENLNLYQVGLTFNQSILEATSFVAGDFFLQAPEEYRTLPINKPIGENKTGLGICHAVGWALKKPGNVSGTGTLATVTFKAKDMGRSFINITKIGVEEAMLGCLIDPGTIEWISFDIVDGTVTIPPTISILSPRNTTYTTSSVPLNFTVNVLTSWIGYSLDGQANVTVSGNTTLTGLSGGIHSVTVCANDTSGNMGSSDQVCFTIFIGEKTPHVFSSSLTYALSQNDDPIHGPNTTFFSDRFDIWFSQPDANGVINLFVPKESYHCETAYDPMGGNNPFTLQLNMVSNGYGKLYTNDSVGDVDIISMTNDTGTYFKKDGVWHPAGEEWIGDDAPDPAGSSWLYLPTNASCYSWPSGLPVGTFWLDFWLTTGFSENIVVEPANLLNGFYINETGGPFDATSGIVTYVVTQARLNIQFMGGLMDLQYKTERGGVPEPALMVTLISPANLYVTDPVEQHIGTDPTTGEYVDGIAGAFYSGPRSEPQRIIIPDPLDGVYDIRLIGTSTGTYNLVVELATLSNAHAQSYSGNIAPRQTLKCAANVSGGEMTLTPLYNLADANHDGYVNVWDLGLMSNAWLTENGDLDYNPHVDFNDDDVINVWDLGIMSDHWLQSSI